MSKPKGKLHRVGDLVKHSLGYDNGNSIDVYCKVICIKDYEGNLYSEYKIVTGHGDRNSKVKLDLKVLCYCRNLKKVRTDSHRREKKLEDNKIVSDVDPHHVYFHYDTWVKETDDKIKFLKEKKEFLLKNKNIIDKIDQII